MVSSRRGCPASSPSACRNSVTVRVSADSLTGLGPPDTVEEAVFRDHLARTLRQVRQQVHDLGPHLDGLAIFRQPTQGGLDQPVAQAKVILHGRLAVSEMCSQASPIMAPGQIRRSVGKIQARIQAFLSSAPQCRSHATRRDSTVRRHDGQLRRALDWYPLRRRTRLNLQHPPTFPGLGFTSRMRLLPMPRVAPSGVRPSGWQDQVVRSVLSEFQDERGQPLSQQAGEAGRQPGGLSPAGQLP